MSDLAGQIDVRISDDGVTIQSTRPLAAARVFVGHPVEQVARRLPLIYSLCASAQATACATACEQALGRVASQHRLAQRARLVAAETVKEHLWRLLLDWPGALAAAIDPNAPLPDDAVVAQRALGMAEVMRAHALLRGAVAARGAPFAIMPVSADGEPLAAGHADAWSDRDHDHLDPDEPTPDPVPAAGQALAKLAARKVFGMPPGDWLAEVGTPETLHAWSETRAGSGGLRPAGGAVLVRDLLRAGLAGLGRNAVPTLPTIGLADPLAAVAAQFGAGAGADATFKVRPTTNANILSAVGQHGPALKPTPTPTQTQTRIPALIPTLAAQLATADAEAFMAAPTWQGRPAETTPFARLHDWPLITALRAEHGNGLLPRLAALLVELALGCEAVGAPMPTGSAPIGASTGSSTGASTGISAPASAETDIAPVAIGVGIGQAARGLLVHRLVLAGDEVLDYRILAPTEWNFHPAGVVAAGLAAIADTLPATVGQRPDRQQRNTHLQRRAALYVTAVDPCVAYRLAVT